MNSLLLLRQWMNVEQQSNQPYIQKLIGSKEPKKRAKGTSIHFSQWPIDL